MASGLAVRFKELKAMWHRSNVAILGLVAGWFVAFAGAAAARAGELDSCNTCGTLPSDVERDINRLLTAPISFTRDAAAHDLRRYDWRCHPEILDALSTALLSDRKAHVRSEAAQTLMAMKPAPCTPCVHGALAKAAASERNPVARMWMQKALKRVGKKCTTACSACDMPSLGGTVVEEMGEPTFSSTPTPFDFEPEVERGSYETQRPRIIESDRPRTTVRPATPPPAADELPLDMFSTRPRDANTANQRPSTRAAEADPFGDLPGLDEPATDVEPLPRPEFRSNEPELLPPAPAAEEAGPFESNDPRLRANREQTRDRFASDRVATRSSNEKNRPTSTRSSDSRLDDPDTRARARASRPRITEPAPEPERRGLFAPLRLFNRRGL